MKSSFGILISIALLVPLGACGLESEPREESGLVSQAGGPPDPCDHRDDPKCCERVAEELGGDLPCCDSLGGDPCCRVCPPEPPDGGAITVLTQNQYVGADFNPAFTATTQLAYTAAVQAAYNQLITTNFALRSFLLASQIAETSPDVVSLQEVALITFNGVTVPGTVFRDYLIDTLFWLTVLGHNYHVVAVGNTWSLSSLIDTMGTPEADGTLSIIDRNVILVRAGHLAVPVNFNVGCVNLPSNGGPGCNYSSAYTNPVIPLVVYRGFIGADVIVGGDIYRVINTRLEDRQLTPLTPLDATIQAAQAFELLVRIAGAPPSHRVLPTGDFESAPSDPPVLPLVFTPYQQFVLAGYTDTWTLDGDLDQPFTCCQNPDLQNLLPLLTRRVDFVFSNHDPDDAEATVLGDELLIRLLFGLWPSDHGSVVAEIDYD